MFFKLLLLLMLNAKKWGTNWTQFNTSCFYQTNLIQVLNSYSRLTISEIKKDIALFLIFVDEFKKEVVQNPEVGGTLGFPCGEPIDKCQLRKQKWARLPSLSGAARLGRLIYLVDNETKIINLVWIYTHKEYEKQPPDRELHKAIKEAFKDSYLGN